MENNTTVVKTENLICGISDSGQVMGRENMGEKANKEDVGALASIEKEGSYEHLATDHLEEGYTLAYKTGTNDRIKYDVYRYAQGIEPLGSQICRNDNSEFVKMTESLTDDGCINIKQIFTFSKTTTRILISMFLTNCSAEGIDFSDFLIKRYADLDVDTGGTAGWAKFEGHWNKTRYSVYSYNTQREAPTNKRSHVVNMIALPGDLPLDDVFIGKHGGKSYESRSNRNSVDSLPTGKIDADGILQWRAMRFLAGETFRINMCYDCYESFIK